MDYRKLTEERAKALYISRTTGSWIGKRTRTPELLGRKPEKFYAAKMVPEFFVASFLFEAPEYFLTEEPEYFTVKAPDFYAAEMAPEFFVASFLFEAPEYFSTEKPEFYAAEMAVESFVASFSVEALW